MVSPISPRDQEYLSAYIDGQLTGKDLQQLEARLAQNAELHAELLEMRRMRMVLRSLPRRRAPRNFTLTPQMVGQRQRPAQRWYPVMGFASALASLLFVMIVLGDFLGFIPSVPSDSAVVQESAPLALVITEAAPYADPVMKSIPPGEEAGVLPDAAAEVTTEEMRLAPTEEGALTMQAAPPEEALPAEEAIPTGVGEEQDADPLLQAVGAGAYTNTLEMPLNAAITPLPSEQASTKVLGTEATPTYTPTPMPTETPVVVATATPTPVPTETPLPTIMAEAVLRGSPTPTWEVLAMGDESGAAESAPAPQVDVVRETADFLPEEQAAEPAISVRSLLVFQIGLLLLAVVTGVAFLFLRLKEV